jgi:hypothetical protein
VGKGDFDTWKFCEILLPQYNFKLFKLHINVFQYTISSYGCQNTTIFNQVPCIDIPHQASKMINKYFLLLYLIWICVFKIVVPI